MLKPSVAVMVFIGVAIWSIFLGSCTDNSVQEVEVKVDNPVSVGYYFMSSTRGVDLAYKKLKRSENSIGFEYLGENHRGSDEREGFHYYEGSDCYIVMVTPEKLPFKKFESLVGHEMIHCFFGSYHPESGVVAGRLKIKQNKGHTNVEETGTN